MKYLIYMSSASHLMSDEELLEILTKSRENNSRKKITGMLLYGEGSFVQVLEGDEKVLEQTYSVILKDPRHSRFIKIASGELAERNFANWSMGFRSINRDVVSEFQGFADSSTHEFLNKEKSHPALTILRTFAKTNHLD